MVWSTSEVDTRLEGLSRQERAACLIAERVLGATARAFDVEGRQGAVDAMLMLVDGRRAAFEVTVLAAPGAIHTEALLDRDEFSWPNPGLWTWTVSVGSARDIPRLREVFDKIALMCERVGISRPEECWRAGIRSDPDLDWLLNESASTLVGHPGVPATDAGRVRTAMVVPRGRGGAVDEGLLGLRNALDGVLGESQMRRHVAKVVRADADEKHLFIPLHDTAFPFPVADGLATGTCLPPEPPPIPPELTHLWLAPRWGRRVLLWSPQGWQQHDPYDR